MFSYMFNYTNINGYFSCVFVVFVLFKTGMKAIKKVVTNLDKPDHIAELYEQKMAVLSYLFVSYVNL